jgi:AcrR family transcriptional regulator
MREIAHAAGVTPAALYSYFPSKEEMLVAILRRENAYAALVPALAGASGDTVADLVHDAAERVLAVLEAHPTFIELVFLDVLEFQGQHVAVLAQEALSEGIPFFGRLVALGTASGTMRPIPPPILARAFLGMMMSYYIGERVVPAAMRQLIGIAESGPDVVRQFVDIFLYGILRSPSMQGG